MLNEINPHFFYSQYNTNRMVEVVDWNNYDKPKTTINTLSYQEEGINKKDFKQLFQKEDAVRNQFQSSYSDHEIIVYGCSGSQYSIEPIKRTNYLNIKDYRTAKVLSYEGSLCIFFGAGNILDYPTEDIIEAYNLNQRVPKWMVSGKNVNISSFGELTIEKIVWLTEKEVYGLKMNVEYTGTEQDVKVYSIYNIFDYNVFEFDLDFLTYDEGDYQIEIKASDVNFETDVIYLSEVFNINIEQKNTHYILSSHNKNTQINYTWGIQHMMRLRYEKPLKYKPDGENDIHKTDDNTILISATNYENYEMELSPLPTGVIITLKMLMSLRYLFIDGRSYVSNSKPTIEPLGDSNLFDVKSELILSNDEYFNKNIQFSSMVESNKRYLKINNRYLMSEGSYISTSV